MAELDVLAPDPDELDEPIDSHDPDPDGGREGDQDPPPPPVQTDEAFE